MYNVIVVVVQEWLAVSWLEVVTCTVGKVEVVTFTVLKVEVVTFTVIKVKGMWKCSRESIVIKASSTECYHRNAIIGGSSSSE